MSEHNSEDKFSKISITPPESFDKEEEDEIIEEHAEETVVHPAEKPSFPRKKRKSRILGGISWIIAFALVIYGAYILAGYILVPYLFRSYLPKKLAAEIDRPVTIGSSQFNPFTLTLTLRNGIIGPKLSNPDDLVDPILSFSELVVDGEAISLIRRGLVCKKIDIDRFFLHLVRESDSTFNISEILKLLQKDTQLQKRGVLSLIASRYSLNNIRMSNGRIVFSDTPGDQVHNVEDINLVLPVLSNLDYKAADYIRPELTATVNGSPVDLSGQTGKKGDEIETLLEMNFTDVNVPDYLSYLPGSNDVQLTEGRADLELSVLFSSGKTSESDFLVDGKANLTGIVLIDGNGDELARIPKSLVAGSVMPLTGRYRFDEVQIMEPVLSLKRSGAGLNIFPDAFQSPVSKNKSVERKKTSSINSGFREFKVDHLQVDNGRITFADSSVPGGFKENISRISFVMSGLATGSEVFQGGDQVKPVSFTYSGSIQDNSSLSGNGSFHLAPLRIDSLMSFKKIQLPKYEAYLKNSNIHIAKGVADIDARLVYEAANTKSKNYSRDERSVFHVQDAAIRLKDISVNEDDREILRLTDATLEKASLDSVNSVIDFGFIKGADGSVGVYSFMNSDDVGIKNEKKWSLRMQGFEMDSINISWDEKGYRSLSPSDIADTHSLKLTDVVVNVGDSAGEDKKRTNIEDKSTIEGSAIISGSGKLEFNGGISYSPFTAGLNCHIEGLDLATVGPLFKKTLQGNIVEGVLQARGLLQFPDIVFDGLVAVDSFKAGRILRDGKVENSNGETDIVIWHAATAEDLRLTVNPFSIVVDRVNIEKPYLYWALYENKDSSLKSLFAGLSKDKKREKIAFNISELNISRGELAYSDHTVLPNFFSKISDISGAINNLQNISGNRARYELQGRTANSPIGFKGVLGSFDDSQYADFVINISDYDVRALTPYLIPHLGWEINEGNLTLNTAYNLQNGQVSSENHLDLKDVKIGGRLKGNSNLPLTVALLRGPDGHIVMDIPVNGKIDDPSFSVGSGIIKVLRNTLLKTAVAPFNLLRAVLTNIETPETEGDLDHLEFPFGTEKIIGDTAKKLEYLAGLLRERPSLGLEFMGSADGLGDRKVILSKKQTEIARKQLAKEIRKSAEIARQYGSEEISKQPKTSGEKKKEKKISPVVSDKELLELAEERADVVRNYLLKDGKIDENRLKISEKKGLVEKGNSGMPGNKVEMKLFNID